jgi:Copper type II ascorbate-dependent monooxygenase, C-terminal domain
VPFSREPVRCNKTPSIDWKLVAGWAPGVGNVELPKEAGFVEEEGDTHWLVQVHYNNAAGGADADTDDSGMDLCSTDKLRTYDADTIAAGSTAFTIPPRSTYDLTCLYTWGSGFLGKGLPETPNIHVFNVQGHMHGLGKAIEVHKIPYGRSKRETIFMNDAYDFNTQEIRDVDVDITQDDILQTRCTWKNTTDAPVRWGEGTNEEMCFAFLSYYPRIVDPEYDLWKWVAPAASTLNHCYEGR